MEDFRTDAELVSAFQGGDEIAYLELVQRYTEKVHNLALRITRNEQDTEEILQDVFVTVFQKIDMFQGKSAFSSWLYRITANTSFMKLRTRKKHQAISLDDASQSNGDSAWIHSRSDSCDISYMSSRHELRDQLEAAIGNLPDEYRMIFVLRDVDGLSNQEVGEILGLSVAAVKSRLHRSRLMLRKKLQRYFDDYSSSDQIHYGYNPYARNGGLQAAA